MKTNWGALIRLGLISFTLGLLLASLGVNPLVGLTLSCVLGYVYPEKMMIEDKENK